MPAMRDPDLRNPFIISQRTHDLIHRISLLGLKDTAEPVGDGTLRIYLADETKERLEGHRFPDESDDDLIFRVITTAIQKATGGLN